MQNLGLIDIGGTSIKFACLKDGELVDNFSAPTPDNLDKFYQVLTDQMDTYKNKYNIQGVGISSPGSVNIKTGIIEGASALPYIHNFEIVQEFEKRFGLPVAIENDANCAALAEVDSGIAKGKKNVVFLVLGTGVGGAVVINGQIHHGSHLLGGEFGYMLADNRTNIVSQRATIRNTVARYNEEVKPTQELDGLQLYSLAQTGDKVAQEYVAEMMFTVAETIFNAQYSIDPELFVLAGGISNNPALLKDVEKHLDEIMKIVEIAPIKPTVAIAKYKSEANLIGAAANYKQRKLGEK